MSINNDLNNQKASNSHSKTDKKKGRTFNIQKVLLVIFLIMFCISGYKIIIWYMDTSKSEEEYKKLVNQVSSDNNKNRIDFGILKQINPDIIGWIKIEGTPVDYPIVQGTDNDYYLKRNFYNEYSVSGTVFADYRNREDFSDKNTVLYGHNMKNGSMFASLLKINDRKQGDNVTIKIYTPQRELTFKVFSSYVTSPDNTATNPSISEDEFLNFVNDLVKNSEVNYEVDSKDINQILTLSTCNNTGKRRVIVHAKLDNVETYD